MIETAGLTHAQRGRAVLHRRSNMAHGGLHPRRTVVSSVLIALLVVVAGCGGGGGSDSPSADGGSGGGAFPADGFVNKQADVQPVRGGTLNVSTYLSTGSLDPATSPGQASGGGLELNAIFDTLMRYDLGAHKYVPQLAEDLVPSSDFKTWTLKLRPNVTFSDGTPLNAAAVVASLKRMVDMKARSTALIEAASSIKATDDLTVMFGLDESWSGFPYVLSSLPGNIVSPTAAQRLGKDFAKAPVGAGAFVVDKFAVGESLALKPRKDYWGGEPYLDQLKFVSFKGGSATLGALQSGGVQAAYLRDANVVTEARKDFPGYLVGQSAGDVLYINNAQGHPGADLRIRQAIAAAVDPEIINQRANNGTGNPGTELFQKSSIWHTDTPGPQHDPAKAKQLVEAAKQSGFDGQIKLVTPNSPYPQAASLAVQAQLQSVGFSVALDNNNEIADFIRKTVLGGPGDFDLSLSGNVILDSAPYIGLYNFYASDSNLNVPRYKNPRLDSLLEQLKVAPDEGAKRTVIGQIQALFTADVPSLPLDTLGIMIAWDKSVHGLKSTVAAQVLFDKAFIAK